MSEGKPLPAKVTPEHTRGAEAVLGRQQSSLFTAPAQPQPFPGPAEPAKGRLRLAKERMIVPKNKSQKTNSCVQTDQETPFSRAGAAPPTQAVRCSASNEVLC